MSVSPQPFPVLADAEVFLSSPSLTLQDRTGQRPGAAEKGLRAGSLTGHPWAVGAGSRVSGGSGQGLPLVPPRSSETSRIGIKIHNSDSSFQSSSSRILPEPIRCSGQDFPDKEAEVPRRPRAFQEGPVLASHPSGNFQGAWVA